jgi:hypothetical protein
LYLPPWRLGITYVGVQFILGHPATAPENMIHTFEPTALRLKAMVVAVCGIRDMDVLIFLRYESQRCSIATSFPFAPGVPDVLRLARDREFHGCIVPKRLQQIAAVTILLEIQ